MEKIEFNPEELEGAKIKLEFPRMIIDRYITAEHEWSSMINFISENASGCDVKYKECPRELRIRYGLSYEWRGVGMAWYLLDQFFKGNIRVNEDVQPKP